MGTGYKDLHLNEDSKWKKAGGSGSHKPKAINSMMQKPGGCPVSEAYLGRWVCD